MPHSLLSAQARTALAGCGFGCRLGWSCVGGQGGYDRLDDLFGWRIHGQDGASCEQIAQLQRLAHVRGDHERFAGIAGAESLENGPALFVLEVERRKDKVGSFYHDTRLELMQRTPRDRIGLSIRAPADSDAVAGALDRCRQL